jgi:hypothetical protein
VPLRRYWVNGNGARPTDDTAMTLQIHLDAHRYSFAPTAPQITLQMTGAGFGAMLHSEWPGGGFRP